MASASMWSMASLKVSVNCERVVAMGPPESITAGLVAVNVGGSKSVLLPANS